MFAQLDTHPHLWILTLDAAHDAQWIAEHEPLLSDKERARYERYLRPDDRHLFLAAHVFARQTLSRYAPIAPADWTFSTNRDGRPEISHAGSPPGLRFNLAHTTGMVAMLVHDEADGGVDVEHLGNVDDPYGMSRTVFADAERSDYLAIPDELREVGFYKLWTLKESFIKAKGKGMAMPLKDFALIGLDDFDIRVECGAEIEPEPGAWHFTVHQPSAQFVVATAYRAGASGPGRGLSVFELVSSA